MEQLNVPTLGNLPTLGPVQGLPGFAAHAKADRPEQRGYALGDAMLSGRGVLSHASFGYELVVRLKDTRPLLREEIGFWAGRVAELARGCGASDGAELVTHAPSSGKVPDEEHLATMLAHQVAVALGLPCVACFQPTVQRGPLWRNGHVGGSAGRDRFGRIMWR